MQTVTIQNLLDHFGFAQDPDVSIEDNDGYACYWHKNNPELIVRIKDEDKFRTVETITVDHNNNLHTTIHFEEEWCIDLDYTDTVDIEVYKRIV